MMTVKRSEIKSTKKVRLLYVFGTTRNEDETIKEVLFNYKNDSGEFCWDRENVESFAHQILNADIISFCGLRSIVEKEWCYSNLAIITPCTTTDKIILKTASDTETVNNLLNLPIYKIKKDNNAKEVYVLLK